MRERAAKVLNLDQFEGPVPWLIPQSFWAAQILKEARKVRTNVDKRMKLNQSRSTRNGILTKKLLACHYQRLHTSPYFQSNYPGGSVADAEMKSEIQINISISIQINNIRRSCSTYRSPVPLVAPLRRICVPVGTLNCLRIHISRTSIRMIQKYM